MRYFIFLLTSAILGLWSGVDTRVTNDRKLNELIPRTEDGNDVIDQPRNGIFPYDPRDGNAYTEQNGTVQWNPRNGNAYIERNGTGPWKPRNGNAYTQIRATSDCGEYTLNPKESIVVKSKNYPNVYPRKNDCDYKFKVSDETSTLTVKCPVIAIKKSKNCDRSSVVFSDGKNEMQKVCGNKKAFEMISNDNSLDIHFESKGKKRAKGFRCTVTASESRASANGGSTTSSYDDTESPVGKTTASPQATSAPSGSNACKCGVVNRQSRIVGGEVTETHEYPWQAALIVYGGAKPFCGASIISDRWILTAAHCLPGRTPTNTQVLIGEHDWSTGSETSNTLKLEIEQLESHPNYNSGTSDNDIALIKVKKAISFPSDNKVATICLPSTTNLFDNVQAVVSGWGDTASGGDQPNVLNEVNVPTMTNAKCQQRYENKPPITDNMICAGLDAGGKDSCQGDSGGPLVTTETGKSFMIQIGVVSFGKGCALADYPGVYARVTKYKAWIGPYIAGSTVCSPP